MHLGKFLMILFVGVASSAVGALEAPTQEGILSLVKESMLYQSDLIAKKYSGEREQWLHPYEAPEPLMICIPAPEKVCDFASVWFTIYPRSMIVPSGSSAITQLSDNGLWGILEEIGIDVLYTGPMMQSGQLVNGKIEPSIDGGGDQIGYEIDPLFGTSHEYMDMVAMARQHKGIIAGDLITGHTGKGPDFSLALRAYKEYPGIYHMIDIDQKDWDALPTLPPNASSINLTPDQVDKLKELKYIIGGLDKIYSYNPLVKLTNWSATPEIMGVDGKVHRWIYLHKFKEGQPSMNWLDPTFGANRIVAGDIMISLGTYRNKILRLDANAFLGEEFFPGDEKAFSYGHPLSIIASDLISMLTRKLGGFTFQELDGSIPMMKKFMEYGSELTYDFITRGAYMDALASGNTVILKLAAREMMKEGLEPNRLVHALQNHDEFNLSFNFMKLIPNKMYNYKGTQIPGELLGRKVMEANMNIFSAIGASYNQSNDSGVCSTILGMAGAALGVSDIYNMTPEQKNLLKKAHLLVTFYNAMQPGVFAISAWDLLGVLPLQLKELPSWIKKDGDKRWLNRGAYDLMNENLDINESIFGIPRAQTIYAPIFIQLTDPTSYASQLKKMLSARKKYGLPQAHIIAIPETSAQLFVALYRLPKSDDLVMVALNFGQTKLAETLASNEFLGKEATDIISEKSEQPNVTEKGFNLILDPLEARAILFKKTVEDKLKKGG